MRGVRVNFHNFLNFHNVHCGFSIQQKLCEINILLFWINSSKTFLSGKVLALRSVQVTDWNGKSLSCTFGTSLEIDPDIPPAKDLKDFYSDSINGSSNSSSNHDFKSLTTNDRGANANMQSTEFVTLKQVHDDFQDAANLTRYYNLCAYLTGKFLKALQTWVA